MGDEEALHEGHESHEGYEIHEGDEVDESDEEVNEEGYEEGDEEGDEEARQEVNIRGFRKNTLVKSISAPCAGVRAGARPVLKIFALRPCGPFARVLARGPGAWPGHSPKRKK